MKDRRQTRRRFIQLGSVVGVAGLAGCAEIISGDDDVQDSDGDGVIDTEDYAPWDPDVQEKSDLTGDDDEQECDCPQTETTAPATDEVLIDDFEDDRMDDWGPRSSGDLEAFQVSTDAVRGEHSGQLVFTDHPAVWKTFDETTPSEISFWWKSGSVSDNELIIAFHEVSEDGWASYDTAGFGMEVGAENSAIVVVNPPFENTRSWVPLYEEPQEDTWYKTRFFNIDFQDHVCDVALYDRSETQLGEVTDHSFGADISAVNYVSIKNAMNFSDASAHIDHILATDT